MSQNFVPGMAHGGVVPAGRAAARNARKRGDIDLDLLSAPNPLDDDGYDFNVEGDTQPSVLQWLEPEPEHMQALVIDPDRESRFYLRAKLAMAGLFLADEAANGAEALYLLKTRRYRVVILDLDNAAKVLGFAKGKARRIDVALYPDVDINKVRQDIVTVLAGRAEVLTIAEENQALQSAMAGMKAGFSMCGVAALIVGMFLESNAAYIMLVPLLHPIAIKFGIDPLHFGFLFVFNLVIGMLTPPVGVVLFVICGIAKISLGELTKHVWPFIAIMYALLFVCMFVPQLVLTVPRMMGY